MLYAVARWKISDKYSRLCVSKTPIQFLFFIYLCTFHSVHRILYICGSMSKHIHTHTHFCLNKFFGVASVYKRSKKTDYSHSLSELCDNNNRSSSHFHDHRLPSTIKFQMFDTFLFSMKCANICTSLVFIVMINNQLVYHRMYNIINKYIPHLNHINVFIIFYGTFVHNKYINWTFVFHRHIVVQKSLGPAFGHCFKGYNIECWIQIDHFCSHYIKNVFLFRIHTFDWSWKKIDINVR